jgi:translocation and assembly module TamB
LQLLASGSMDPVQDPPFAFKATATHIDPSDFIDMAKGDVALEAALTGSLDNPQGTLSMSGKKVALAGQALDSFSLDGRLDQRKLWIDRLAVVVAPQEEITATGWVGMDRTMAMDIKTDGVAITHIQQLKDRVSGDGTLRLAASAKGSMQNPDIDGNLSISAVTINGEAMDDMHLAFSLHDMRIQAQGDLNAALEATCDLREGDFDIDLNFDNTETASYFKAAGMPDLHGKLSGRINAAGNIRDALNASAQVDLNALHLMSGKISLANADRIRMQLADRKLSIPEFEVDVLSTGKIRLEGDARFDGRLNMSVNGRLPLAAVGAFSPDLADAAGIVALDGRITGNADAPRIDARIDLERIAMVVPGLAQKLRDLNGRILVTDDTIHVQDVNGFLDTGSFSLEGAINHERFTPTGVNLALKAKALPLDVPDTLSILLNGDVTITGNDGIAEAKGEIVILEGIYYKDVKISLLKLATERQRAVAPESPPPRVPFFDTVNLDVAIRHRQAFEVDNNMAQLAISPDIEIGGTLARPIVSGRAQVNEGTVTFQKKTFEVTKGVIDFVNPYKTEAEIDIVSQAEIRSWTITLAIKGPPDNLEFQLSSVPSETDADILSLILFGKTNRELTSGEGGSTLSTGQIMAEMIADTFGDDIKKNTGIDILEVEENGSSDEDAGGVTVTVGKHLSDRMTVKYAVESKDGEIIQRAISEYKLLEHILVSGFQDSKGVYGSELVFRIEFR